MRSVHSSPFCCADKPTSVAYLLRWWIVILGLACAVMTSRANAAPFVDDMNNSGGNATSFSRTLAGTSFTYTFTANGDSGDLALENQYRVGNSASMIFLSFTGNFATTERVIITRTDLAPSTFTSVYIDYTNSESVTVGGYLGGVLVGSSQAFGTGTTTMNFGGIQVDEVRFTSVDFLGLALPPPPLVAWRRHRPGSSLAAHLSVVTA